MTTSQFPISWVRDCFPALNSEDNFIFFDNGAGAQVPQTVLDAVQHHLISRNVQRGGRYRHSREVDEAIQRARDSVAIFLNARDPAEVAFGMNATSFIRIVSQAIAENIRDRREIIVTDLDHEANVATWLDLQRKGCEIRWWKMREDATLHTSDLEPLLNSRTRLVACTMASNALGSIVNAKEVAGIAHAAGAEVFLDAVHYAPHGSLDVQDLDCDYLVCSGYKIFAPHMGFVWGKRAALEALPTFREDFIPNQVPMKIEVGTFVYENVAGMDAAIGYLEELGRQVHADALAASRRDRLVQGMEAIRAYEASLSLELLKQLSTMDEVAVYGIRDPLKVSQRVPTVCFNVRGVLPCTVSEKCAARSIGIRDGNMYSPRLLQRLQIPADPGAVRASLVHYNTVDEIRRFAHILRKIGRS
ncbi:MAG TPA: cysteine desulfurase-like protein [Terriglobales bacterium]|nr:cysteine desulfurase-like protein [Terriglobales bacterium]